MQKTNNKKTEKRISNSTVALIGTIFTITGGFFLSYNYIESKKVLAFDEMSNLLYKEETKVEKEETEVIKEEVVAEPVNTETVEEVQPDQSYNQYQYIGYLEIPKINLTKGFLPKDSADNNIEKNIMVMPESNYPDVANGNMIITGHSGSGWKAFFDNLEKLVIGDKAHIDYQGKRYTYNITNIYTESKDGNIAIYRNYNKTTLTLVTCTNDNDFTQTIYIAELESVA